VRLGAAGLAALLALAAPAQPAAPTPETVPAQTTASPAAEPPVEPSDSAIDERIRESAVAAEGLQGPLDGGWTLVTASGQAIYAFQFVDKPGGEEPLQGVWRDLRRPSAPGDIGVVDTMTRGAQSLTLAFVAKAGAAPVTISLQSGADGGWSGELREAGAATRVSLRRGER
jgi:hypothetical protein